MGLYEDQLAKIQRTKDFLQRQIDLSDNNQSDVIDALLNNTWGTTNTFNIDGTIRETDSNLEQYLIQEGFDVDSSGKVIIPNTVDRSIWDPVKLDVTRQISSIVPEGSGISLTELQKTIDKITGEIITSNNAYVTSQRDLNPIQEDMANIQCFGCNGEQIPCGLSSICVLPRDTIENDPLLNDEQKQSTLAVFGILMMLVAG